MAGLPPGDPQLVSMIVNHLKTQGLFDQFRRDCLADVDTKPAYLNLKQRVDNFVSNHLSNHTWSPHLNKNQLRNNIRQLVLQIFRDTFTTSSKSQVHMFLLRLYAIWGKLSPRHDAMVL
uniref:Biorientation of chromosomes in cell division protein 1-like 1 n=1 Tax=Fundulus heteroclitus TaxID=8078 RepID=A0A3Q2PKT3_FUNHE